MMAGRDLSEADLSCASLRGADLRGVNLAHASLFCADLRDCDLRNARLDHADLRGASFKGANLSHAILDQADLRPASLLYMGDTVKFQGNSHSESPFGAVDFSQAMLRYTSFRNTKLDNANFTDASIEGAAFRGSRLRNACFRNAVMTGVHLDDLSSRALEQALRPPSPDALERAKPVLTALWAHHEWFVSGGKKGRPAMIDGEDLRPLAKSLKGLCLAGLSARRVIAYGVDFSGCQLQAAHLDGADLRVANFDGADLSGTDFSGAKLSHASFKDAKIGDLTLCNGKVKRFSADTDGHAPAQLQRHAKMIAQAGLSAPLGSC
ncbi:hypothetical protein GCM10008941_28970 [Rhizomicrobium palustre]